MTNLVIRLRGLGDPKEWASDHAVALCEEAADEIESLRRWTKSDDPPPRNVPVLCAWRSAVGWTFDVAKWTGKRWLEVVPETANEEFLAPNYWQEIKAPSEISAVEPSGL